MRILLLPLLLLPLLANAQLAPPGHQRYESPAMVTARVKAQCAALPAQQRPDCSKKAQAEVRASINRHHDLKRKGSFVPPARTARTNPQAPRPPQK